VAKHGISPGRFAEVMQVIQKADPHIRHESGYLPPHPATVGRTMKVREAAESFGVTAKNEMSRLGKMNPAAWASAFSK
jgi:hypothetical protein